MKARSAPHVFIFTCLHCIHIHSGVLATVLLTAGDFIVASIAQRAAGSGLAAHLHFIVTRLQFFETGPYSLELSRGLRNI